MKIEKKKVAGKVNLSSSAKVGVASLLGMTSVFLSGCLSDAESGAPMSPAEPDSTGSTTETSSSSAIDIPLSHEHLSSIAENALSSSAATSSSAEKLSSSSFKFPMISSSGVINPYSSSSIAMPPRSSSSVDIPPGISSSVAETPSSSSEKSATSSSQTDESSSSVKDTSSSSTPSTTPPFARQCEMQDSTGIRVIMCHDDDWGMMASMVSTYEMSDMS
jgi:hypothetical protein